MDRLTPIKRSWLMSRIKGRDTKPELIVRKMISAMGYRYRLYRKDLPGKPDIVFVSKRKVIFIHGCYWHGHNCKKGKLPKSNISFWKDKIETNKVRDKKNIRELKLLGWTVLTIWQCQLKKTLAVCKRIVDFLELPIDS
jgi:DNA mismatch endonuclease, patch repair protein